MQLFWHLSTSFISKKLDGIDIGVGSPVLKKYIR